MLKMRKYPILEFDKDKEGFINPSNILGKYGVHDFPSQLIVCFFKEVINDLIEKKEIKEYLTINGENPYIFYRFIDSDIAIVHGSVGAPACVGQIEEGIALGAKRIMFCGGGGSLDKKLTVGKILVVTSAIRDEGTSYHYIKPSREIKVKKETIIKLTEYLKDKNIEYLTGKAWTTDAFYRETKAKIRKRKLEGALIVEMEQSACIAVAEFREVSYGALLYGGDDLTKEKWDSREWRHKINVRRKLLDYCKDLVFQI